MEKIIIGGIVGAMYAGAIAIFKSASHSQKFTPNQIRVLLILIIFPPLFFMVYIALLIFNNVKYASKSETKQIRQSSNKISELENVRDKLEYLKNSSLLTEEEFSIKSKKIDDNISFEYLINTEEYKNLKQLLDVKVLTTEEFNTKIELLKKYLEKQNLFNINSTQQYNIIDGFRDGYAKVINEDLEYGFIDESGKLVIPFFYELAENFSESLAMIMINGKFGYIDKNNNIIISPKFDNAESFYNDKAKVKINGDEYFINKAGSKI